MDRTPLKEIRHADREESLCAAKRSLRGFRRAFMRRRTDLGADVLDIVSEDGTVLERHVAPARPEEGSIRESRTPVEEMALYQ